MTLPTVEENSSSYLTVTLLDKDDAPAQPTSASYDVVDDTADTKIKDGVALTFVDGVVEITLDKADAKIIDDTSKYEERTVSIHAIYASEDELHAEYLYRVRNLSQVSTP